MFYYIFSTKYQKIGNLFYLVIFLNFRTVWQYMCTMAKNTSFLKPCLFIMHKLKENIGFYFFGVCTFKALYRNWFFHPYLHSYCFRSDISFKEPAFRHICLGFWHQNIPLKAFSKQSISNALEKCFCWKKWYFVAKFASTERKIKFLKCYSTTGFNF